jgi:hypothetical protein
MAGLVPAIPIFSRKIKALSGPQAARHDDSRMSIEAGFPLNFGHNSHRQ